MKFNCFCGEELELDMTRKNDPTNMVKCPKCGLIHGTYNLLDSLGETEK